MLRGMFTVEEVGFGGGGGEGGFVCIWRMCYAWGL